MSIASDLRTLALSRATRLRQLHVILDDELRDEVRTAQQSLALLEQRRLKMEADGDLPPAAPTSLADKAPKKGAVTADIDRMIEACREVVTSAEAEARESGKVLVVNLRALGAADYQRIHAEAAKKAISGKLDQLSTGRAIADAILAACYVNCSTVDGTPVDMTLDELSRDVLSSTELDTLRNFARVINEEASIVDFRLSNSGTRGVS